MGEAIEGWQQRAAFSVFFDVSSGAGTAQRWRTRAYHEETGDEITVTETDPNTWAVWIRQHLRTGSADSDLATGPLSTITVEVASARLTSEPRMAGAEEPASVRVELTVAGLTDLGRAVWTECVQALLAEQ